MDGGLAKSETVRLPKQRKTIRRIGLTSLRLSHGSEEQVLASRSALAKVNMQRNKAVLIRGLQRLVRCECENHFMRSNVTTVSPTVWRRNCVGVWLTMVTVVSGTPACLSESPRLKVSLLPWTRQVPLADTRPNPS